MSIYNIAKTKLESDIEQAQKILTFSEIMDVFLDSVKRNRIDFYEDIKEELVKEGYFIIKPSNLLEKIKLEEFEDSLHPYLNQRTFL